MYKLCEINLSNRDAAHSIHPLAGQGLNLGLGDAECLASVLMHYYVLNQDIGLDFILAEYSKRQMLPNLFMQTICHGIQGFYDDRDPGDVASLRVRLKQELAAQAMNFLDKNPLGLKKIIMDIATKSSPNLKQL